jgi:carboxyl-terminal processing protease
VKTLVWLLLAVSFILATSCRQTSRSAPAVATPRAIGGDSVGEAYRLILQRSAEPVDAAAVATAGVKGLRVTLMADGVAPPNVPTPTFSDDPNQDVTLLQTTVTDTTNHYASKINSGAVDDAVIGAMAASVGDCHTAYFTPAEFDQQRAWIQGQMQFGGIGASLRKPMPTEPLVIWRVFAGTPAAQAGLQDGDVIRAVDGRDVTTFTVQAVVDLIRGPVGQPVKLTIKSASKAAERTVTIVRAQIQPPSVEYRMLANHVGYVQLYGFPENVAGQVKQALDALDRQGATAWILDLRDNGGGSLDAVTQVTSMFVPKGTLLYYLYDGNGQRTDYVGDGSTRSRVLPAAVLVNDGTGSGAEIFAAVLGERGVAKLVGETSAGCVGTGQLFPLPSGGGIQVTVAQLLTGKGKILNRVGVTPDVEAAMSYQDLISGRDPQLDQAERLLHPAS